MILNAIQASPAGRHRPRPRTSESARGRHRRDRRGAGISTARSAAYLQSVFHDKREGHGSRPRHRVSNSDGASRQHRDARNLRARHVFSNALPVGSAGEQRRRGCTHRCRYDASFEPCFSWTTIRAFAGSWNTSFRRTATECSRRRTARRRCSDFRPKRRCRLLRRQDARKRRDGAARPAETPAAGFAGRHAHGARHDRFGGRRDEARSIRLPDEAVHARATPRWS